MERPAKRPRNNRPRATVPTATSPPATEDVANEKPEDSQTLTCPNPECTDPKIEDDDDGLKVCVNCGALVREANIVSEVTFGETTAGAAVVQGGFVGEGSRHAKTLSSALLRHNGPDENHEVSENRGREQINRLSNNMEPNLSETIRNQAMIVYRLLVGGNFIQGRQVQEVAAACLYLACRRAKDNQILLMDFAEILQVSVYKLGKCYSDVKKELCLDGFDKNGGQVPVIQPEKLIYRFARRMEFKDKLMRVCEDASKLMKRMKRDWMVTGRSPAGLCGACLILAARMNNFRRTIRETVFHVRVAALTVQKRLDEFKRTKASELSVQDFRAKSHLLKKTADPPAIYYGQERDERKRRESEMRASTVASTPRVDSDGFAVPNTPIQQPTPITAPPSQVSEEVSSNPEEQKENTKSKRGGKKRKEPKIELPKQIALYAPSTEDLFEEEMLEDEINHLLEDQTVLKEVTHDTVDEIIKRSQQMADAERSKGPVGRIISNEETIDEDEFADDPEVTNCILNEREQKIKERIWVTHNEDWLRTQQAKLLKKTLDEAHGLNKKKTQKRPRKRTRMGDGSLLEDSGPVSSPAEAAHRMLEKHSKNYSKHIDYDKLNQLYRVIRNDKDASTGTATNVTSVAGSIIDGTERTSVAPASRATSVAASEPPEEPPIASKKKKALKSVAIREAASGLVQKEALRKEQAARQEEYEAADDESGPEEIIEAGEDGPDEFDELEEGDDNNEDPNRRLRRVFDGMGVDEEDLGIEMDMDYENDDPSRYLEEDEQVGFDEEDMADY